MADVQEVAQEEIVGFEEGISASCYALGIFRVRCAAHSLQLVAKDFEAIAAVKIALEAMEGIIEAFYGSPERVESLESMQKAMNKKPLKIVRPNT